MATELHTAKREMRQAHTVEAQKSAAEFRADAARARAELASTMDAIEHKLNFPMRAKSAARRLSFGLRTLGDENPLALIGIAVGAASAFGLVVWAGVKAVQAHQR